MSAGRGSDRAYYGYGAKRKLYFAHEITNAKGWVFECPACGSELYHSKGHRYKAASFNHMPGTDQSIKDDCPIYSGKQSSTEFGDAYVRRRQPTLALEVSRSQPRRWRLFFRLPATGEYSGRVEIKTSEKTTTRAMLNGVDTQCDVQIVPRRTVYRVLDCPYATSLSHRELDARKPTAFVFPVRHGETSARCRRMFWGFSYYVLTERNITVPADLTPVRLEPPMATYEYTLWQCLQITLPHAPAESLRVWFERNAGVTIEVAPYKVRLLFGAMDANHISTCYGDTRSVLIVSGGTSRDIDKWLAVGVDPTQYKTYKIDARVSVAKMAPVEACTVGIASSENDDAWPLALFIERQAWSEPQASVLVASGGGQSLRCTLGEEMCRQVLDGVRNKFYKLHDVSESHSVVEVRHRSYDDIMWESVCFDLRSSSEGRRLVGLLNDMLVRDELDVIVDVRGLASFSFPSTGPIVVEESIVEQRPKPFYWATYASRIREMYGVEAHRYGTSGGRV